MAHSIRLAKARKVQNDLKVSEAKKPGSGLNWKAQLTIPETPRIIGVQPRLNEQIYGQRASRSMLRNINRVSDSGSIQVRECSGQGWPKQLQANTNNLVCKIMCNQQIATKEGVLTLTDSNRRLKHYINNVK